MNHRISRMLTGLGLMGAVSLPLTPLAGAAEYTDLDRTHWAYTSMIQASSLGLMNGVGDGRMDPSGTMSWGQFLTVLTRTFAPEEYAAATAAGESWDQAGYTAAVAAGLLRMEDGLPVSREALDSPITRQDAAVLLSYTLPEEGWRESWREPLDPTTLTDWAEMDTLHQEAVAALAEQYVVSGKSDGSFGYADTIQRADGATLLMRTLQKVDSSRSGERKTVTFRFVDTSTGEEFLPAQEREVTVDTSFYYTVHGMDVGYYNYNESRQGVTWISSACDSYTLYYDPMTESEIQEAQFWEKVERGEANAEDYFQQDFWLNFQGENRRKYTLLFGSEEKRRFENQAEAEQNMTTVTVPVWHLNSSGQKVAATATLVVHAALAEDVTEIFTEIYNDPEQFPIHDLGGYSWRGDEATGEHNCGTAIDINANENYQVRNGQALVGSHWLPGSDPYSIGPDSSVVRIFAEHGWSWGGDAWAMDSDDSSGYHDYMHFSYMGM